MGAMPDGFSAHGNVQRLAMSHQLDLLFQDAQFGRIDQVVAKINGQKRRPDLFQSGAGVVIERTLNGVEQIAGVQRCESGRDLSLKQFIRLLPGSSLLMAEQRVTSQQEKNLGGDLQVVRLGWPKVR